MPKCFRLLLAGCLWAAACASSWAQDCYMMSLSPFETACAGNETPISERFSDWELESAYAWAKPEKRGIVDTAPRPKNKMTAKEARKAMTFAERNSGAFRTKKHGGVRSPGMAALCSAVVPGLGQCYNAQWYKPPVIYAGAVVIAYFVDYNLKEKRVYEREIYKRFYGADASILNPELSGADQTELLRLRNYHEQNFELTLIIAGAVYLLNIIDAVVYAHLFDFNVTPNLAMKIEPYACPDFGLSARGLPMDMGFRLCMTFK